ncbi:MAG: CPXCG motif-containing cysteine-rich protein [Gammaproteobacteria bacterium]|nr:CPXCG motif-containing cysteine-rich protein [Gammaproteobacteria bacterium]
MHEHRFDCPWCGESVTMVLDLSVDTQTYIEDCEVCCNPILIEYTASEGASLRLTAERAQ